MATAAGAVTGLQTPLDIRDLHKLVQLLKKHRFSKTRYHPFGLSLGLYDDTLKVIENNYKGDTDRCLSETLGAWLRKVDNVESKGDPSYHTLIAALRAMEENAVADGIDREKHPACVILARHQSDQSLQASLPSLVILLHKEGIIGEMILPATGGTQVLLSAVRKAVCVNHENLEKFATILKESPASVSVGQAILKDYKNEFHVDVISDEDIARGARNQDDDRSLWPKDINQLLQSVGVVTYRNVDLTSSGPYESQVVDCKSLKELISNPSTTVTVQPFLFSLSGLPRSGKTAAFNTFMTHPIKSNSFVPPDVKTRPQAADDLAHYDLIAVPDDNAPGRLLITEATREFSCVFGLLSAFKQLLSKGKRVPLLDPKNASLQDVFEETELNDHLKYMYRYIGASFYELDDEGKLASYAEKLKNVYPEKNALVNIWDVPSNSAIHDVLLALQGHFTNNHLALLLDLERELDDLQEPPKVDDEDRDLNLMKWRPRIHYLLRTCRMSESFDEKENRSEICTVFATHNDDSDNSEELKRKIDKLRVKVKSAAEQIGVSKLLDYKIKTVSRKGFHNLNQKIKSMISKAPSEEIPIAWLFLRSMFHLSSKVFRHKDELKALAVECGMDDSSLKRFGKFYTSFGSIFDVSLVNPDANHVIVKPILFLKKVNELFSSKHHVFPTIAYGIVPESVGFKIFGEDWPAYIDSLICLNLATEIASVSIEMPPDVPLNDPNDTYYFISLCRRNGRSIRENDPNSVHLITGISTPSGVFNQVKFTRLLLDSQPQRKLVACKNPNQTIIKDTSSGTTVTWVDFGPATQLHLSKPNPELCSAVVQAYREMASGNTVDYKFVKFCVTGNASNPCELVSTCSHILPVGKHTCEQCRVAGRLDDTEVWNEALERKSSTRIGLEIRETFQEPVIDNNALRKDIVAESSSHTIPPTQSNIVNPSTGATERAAVASLLDDVEEIEEVGTNGAQQEMCPFSEASLQHCLNEKPEHVDLMKHLSNIDDKWNELGIGLQLKPNDLESAKKESSNTLSLNYVLERWRDNTIPPYTWATILDVISGPFINNKRLFEDIKRFLIDKLLRTKQVTDSSLHAVTQSDVNISECSEEYRRSKKHHSSQKHSTSSQKKPKRDVGSSSITKKRKRSKGNSSTQSKYQHQTNTGACAPPQSETTEGAVGYSRYHEDQRPRSRSPPTVRSSREKTRRLQRQYSGKHDKSRPRSPEKYDDSGKHKNRK